MVRFVSPLIGNRQQAASISPFYTHSRPFLQTPEARLCCQSPLSSSVVSGPPVDSGSWIPTLALTGRHSLCSRGSAASECRQPARGHRGASRHIIRAADATTTNHTNPRTSGFRSHPSITSSSQAPMLLSPSRLLHYP